MTIILLYVYVYIILYIHTVYSGPSFIWTLITFLAAGIIQTPNLPARDSHLHVWPWWYCV